MERTGIDTAGFAGHSHHDGLIAGARYGQTIVVKYGGAAMADPHLRQGFARDIASLRAAGVGAVVVHGGRPHISALVKRSGGTPRFVAGMRVTDDETMVLVETALRDVNAGIVRALAQQRVAAVGFAGWETSVVHASRRLHVLPSGETVDLGRVGNVAEVEVKPIRALQQRGVVPVIAPIGIATDAFTYNVNADLVAGEVAAALGANVVVFLTDGPGVLAPDGCRYRRLSRWGADTLVREGAVDAGMLPTIEAAVRALKGGAGSAHIIDGRMPHALPRSLRARHGLGTEIVL